MPHKHMMLFYEFIYEFIRNYSDGIRIWMAYYFIYFMKNDIIFMNTPLHFHFNSTEIFI